MKKKKIIIVLTPLIVIFTAALAITFIFVIMPLLPTTKHKFKDYRTFRQKANTAYLAETMPQSAEPDYYYHSAFFSKQAGYRVQLANADYELFKKDAQERYLSYESDHKTNGSLYTGSSDGSSNLPEKLGFRDEELDFINDRLLRSDEGFYLLYELSFDDNTIDCIVGTMCNDKTNELIEFYVRKPDTD